MSTRLFAIDTGLNETHKVRAPPKRAVNQRCWNPRCVADVTTG